MHTHAEACPQGIHTNTFKLICIHTRIRETHTLIIAASHRPSALHVGHGIKGGGSAGV